MERFSNHDFSAFISSSYVWSATVFVLLLYYTSLPQAPIYGSFQRVGGTIFRWTAVQDVVAKGYKTTIKPSNKPIVVRWWAKDYLIMPARYLVDLRTASWSHLHFFKNISDALFLYATVDDLYTSHFADRMVDVVKKGLNPRLPQLTPILLEEITYGFEKELTAGKAIREGSEVRAMDFFSGIMHRAATRVMIGTELCRNESFLKTTTSMLQSIFFTAIVAVNLPLGPFRPYLVSVFTLPHKRKNEKCSKMLQPIVEERIQNRQSKGDVQKYQYHIGDAIEWTLDLAKGDSKYDTPERLTHELLHNLWAASSAPGGMMTEIVYQMLTYPEYMAPLRKEADEMVKEHGWTEKMLANLHLQDSFVREVNRMLPTGAITCSRTVTEKPFEFSDGLMLPVGTRFGFPIKAMQNDSDNYESPEKFDGFRFFKKSQAESGDGGTASDLGQRWSSTAMSSTNLAWGYGNHICPGRFFAIRAIKFILTKLLLEYDIGWDRPKGAERPKCVNVEGQFVPNLSQKVWIKARK